MKELSNDLEIFKETFSSIWDWHEYFDNDFYIGKYGCLSEYHGDIAQKEINEIKKRIPYSIMQKLLTYANVINLNEIIEFENVFSKISERDFNIYLLIKQTNTDSLGKLIKFKSEKVDQIETSFLFELISWLNQILLKSGYKVELQ